MNISPTYRLFLAVFHIVLYAFIATPVQVWHHHHNIGKQFAKASGEASPFFVVSKNIQPDAEADCPVCTHHYSIFTGDGVIPVLNIPSFIEGSFAVYQLPGSAGIFVSLTNKGPPVVA